MAANSSVSLINLDPDSLKQSFITFLQAQSIFKDANFKGSNFNVLLDLLAHNTYIGAFYTNMLASEAFLDSAQLRDSAVSRAKELNYTPASASSAEALVNVTFQTNGISILTIPKATQFSGINSNGNFSFVTDADVVIQSPNNFFSANLSIFEGLYINETFVVDYTVDDQRFVLSNQNIDTSSLSVVLNTNLGANVQILTPAVDLYGLNSNSAVFFVQAAENNQYEIIFGDDVFGAYPLNGTVVTVNYRVCDADEPNGINTFLLNQDLGTINGGTVSQAIVTTLGAAEGGAPVETLSTIKFRAPRYYQTQGNAVTADDYADIILQEFGNIGDVAVYGGGITSTAVSFGKVFIAAVSTSGTPLTITEKNEIIQFLQNRVVLSITPQMVDPTFLYLEITTQVNIDFTQTVLTASAYQNLILQAVETYNTSNFNLFNKVFYFSQFTEMLNDIDEAILSNETSVQLKKILPITLNSNNILSFSFNNPVKPFSVYTSQFTANGNVFYMTDNGNNVLNMVQVSSNTSTPIGTVSYSNGALSVSTFVPTAPIGSTGLNFYATPQNQDVDGIQTDILTIDSNNINITISSG